MVTEQAALLPLHDFLARLEAWQTEQSNTALDELRASFERIVSAYGGLGGRLTAVAPPLAQLELLAGTLAGEPHQDGRGDAPERPPVEHRLDVTGTERAQTTLLIDGGSAEDIDQLVDAVELALTAVWAKNETIAQRRQLEALDLAVRGIASIAAVERVLQVIVDRVRDLVGAQYAALGIVGYYGHIDQFIVSGITPDQRALLGAPPEGHGLLGLIIREDRALLIDDINTDPRRYGFPEHHPTMTSLLGVPVRSKSRTIGNLYLTNKITAPTFSEDDLQLIERFALHAAIAIENARLHEEIGRLAIVDERQRISQDLHDSIIQSLYAISLSLEDLPDVITEDPSEGAARADKAIDSIHATIRDIRNFIMGLQPEMLAEADLVTGVQTLAAEFEGNTLIDLELKIDGELVEPPREYAAHVLAITREALSNIARHSGATRASLELAAADGTLRLVIGDNGRGFDVAEARSNRQRGLTNLNSRAEAIGGTMSLNSEPGAGTRLELRIPISSPSPSEAPGL